MCLVKYFSDFLNDLSKFLGKGKYEAASREFIKILCQTWVNPNLTSKDLFIRQGWYKFKKSRDQRQRSHFSEWKVDVLTYINQQTTKENPYLKLQKKDITSALGVPERSLDHVLKELQFEGKILYSFKRGRGGGILIASVLSAGLSLLEMTRQARELYYQYLSRTLEQSKGKVANIFETFIESLSSTSALSLFEIDTG